MNFLVTSAITSMEKQLQAFQTPFYTIFKNEFLGLLFQYVCTNYECIEIVDGRHNPNLLTKLCSNPNNLKIGLSLTFISNTTLTRTVDIWQCANQLNLGVWHPTDPLWLHPWKVLLLNIKVEAVGMWYPYFLQILLHLLHPEAQAGIQIGILS